MISLATAPPAGAGPAAPPPAPRRPRHAWRWVLAVLLLLLAGGGLALRALLPDDAELARRAAQAFEQRFGIALQIGRAHWALRPVPVVVFDDVATAQPAPITLRHLALYPQWRSALRRRIEFSRVELQGLVLPRASLRAFRGQQHPVDGPPAGIGPGAGGWRLADTPVHRLRFEDLRWIDRRGIALAYDGEVAFDAGWRPREAQIERPGVAPRAQLRLARTGEVVDDSASRPPGQAAGGAGETDTDRWQVAIEVGGGSWNGDARLQRDAQGGWRLQAALTPKQVDLEALLGAFGRRSAVAGRVSGQTTLDAAGADPGALLRNLHTRTRFSVQPATVRHFDLAKAVTSAGTRREGQTVLDELTGVLDTQATDDGMALHYSRLHARSGVLSASGDVRVLNRRLQGEVAVDLVDGLVGVPLQLSGTLDKPELLLPPGALAGAAVGSAVAPGVGTAIGARIGQQIERLFGSKRASPAPRAAPRTGPPAAPGRPGDREAP